MAKLQMLTRLGTPAQPLQSVFLSSCSLRLSPASCAVSSTRRHLSVSVSACGAAATSSTGGAASSNESCLHCKYKESCITGGWANYSGSRTERGICRTAALLETEAPVLEESTRSSESTQLYSSKSTFEAQVEAGRVECGSRGCRPIFDEIKEEDYSSTRDEEWGDDGAFSLLEARSASYTERRSVRDLEMRQDVSFPLDFAEFVNDVWHEKSTATKYFDIAMKKNPNDANILLRYAQFAWKTLGDLDKADELFGRAIEESHNDADVNATYALFLWQTEEEVIWQCYKRVIVLDLTVVGRFTLYAWLALKVLSHVVEVYPLVEMCGSLRRVSVPWPYGFLGTSNSFVQFSETCYCSGALFLQHLVLRRFLLQSWKSWTESTCSDCEESIYMIHTSSGP